MPRNKEVSTSVSEFRPLMQLLLGVLEKNMFNNLADRFDSIFKALKKTGSIDEATLDNSIRDIRRALLEADVSLPVVKDFIDQVKKEALGKEVLRSITPAQMIIKIVNDELIKILGSESFDLNIYGVSPTTFLFA